MLEGSTGDAGHSMNNERVPTGDLPKIELVRVSDRQEQSAHTQQEFTAAHLIANVTEPCQPWMTEMVNVMVIEGTHKASKREIELRQAE
jgi:hypothetical protein